MMTILLMVALSRLVIVSLCGVARVAAGSQAAPA